MAAGMQIDIAPEVTTTDPVSGITRYILGGMKVTRNFTSPDGAKYTVSYILGRAEVASVNVPTSATVATSATRSAATLGGVSALRAPQRPAEAAARPAIRG
jgi:hypothetical protein